MLRSKNKTIKSIAVIIMSILTAIIVMGCDDNGDDRSAPPPPPATEAGETAPAAPPEDVSAPAQPVATGLRSEDFANYMEIFDERVLEIEINQALSRGFDTETGEFFLLNHFVGGRETAIFVEFTMPVVDLIHGGTSPFLVIYRDGEFITEIDWVKDADEFTLLFQARSMSDVDNWAVGEYEILLYMDGDLAGYRVSHFHQSSPYSVLMVPVRINYSGHVSGPHGIWKTAASQIYATFPIARAELDIVIGAELDLSHIDIDQGDDAFFELWWEVANLQTRNNDWDVIIGIVPYNMAGGVLGFTFGAPAVIANEEDPEMISTVVHEIAHVFGIGDEYEGGSANVRVNMMPYGMTGRDKIEWAPDYPADIGTRYAVFRGMDIDGFFGEGSPIFHEQRPYYVAGRKLLYNPISYMSSGGIGDPWRLWVTSEQWIHKHRVFTGVDAHLIDPFTTELLAQNMSGDVAMFAAARVAAQDIEALEIRGNVTAGGVFTALPWYHFETCSTELDTFGRGDFAVVMLDASENVISETIFDVDFYAEVFSAGGEREFISFDSAPIDILVEFPDNTAAIAITYQGDEIYFALLSSVAPEVAFTGMYDYMALDDIVTLTWEASGEGQLFFDLWYSPVEDAYFNLATDITGNSITVDLSEFPGTNDGFFYIYVTDGVRTSSAYSPWVTVEFAAPLIITVQEYIPEFAITDEIMLEVEVFDRQDGFMWDMDQLFWMLGDEEFFAGDTLWVWPYELGPGQHDFVLEAENSAGLVSYAYFSIYIHDDESALPSDWSQEYIVTALRNGFVADLSRIDAPINRGRFAHFMFLQFLMAQGAEHEDDMWAPEFVEDVVIDVGEAETFAAFLMVYLGLMDAPDGRFNPSGTVTELEAALIMGRISSYANPDYFGENLTDDEILDFLFSYGILDNDGPNALNDQTPLTNGLAMARLGLASDILYFAD